MLNRKSGGWIFMAAQLHTGQCLRNQGPRQSAHDFHHTMEILRQTMFDTAFPPRFTQASWFSIIPKKSNEYKKTFFDILMSKMIVMLRSEKVTVWEWREWQMVLNQYTATRSPVHTRKASVGVQPLKIPNLLLFAGIWNTFFSSDEKVLEGDGTFEKCDWDLSLVPILNDWCSGANSTFSGRLWIHSLPVGPYGAARTEAPLYQRWVPSWLFFWLFAVFELLGKQVGVAPVDGRFALKSFGSIIVWNPTHDKKATEKAENRWKKWKQRKNTLACKFYFSMRIGEEKTLSTSE